MKTSTVIIIVVTIMAVAGLVLFVVFKQAQNTLTEAEKSAKIAGDVTTNIKDIINIGKKTWDDAKDWYEGQT